MTSTAENGESEDDDANDDTTDLQANESQTQVSDTKGSVHPGDLWRMMSKKGSRSANMVTWSMNTSLHADMTPSDAWGGDSGTASSQSSVPPTPFSFSDELDRFAVQSPIDTTDKLDFLGNPVMTAGAPTDELDLLSSPVTTPSATERTGNSNPFTPQYDPFADVWDKGDDPHFC